MHFDVLLSKPVFSFKLVGKQYNMFKTTKNNRHKCFNIRSCTDLYFGMASYFQVRTTSKMKIPIDDIFI